MPIRRSRSTRQRSKPKNFRQKNTISTAAFPVAATKMETPPRIDIKTKILYGIVATEQSFLIGYRKLVKEEHARMLAKKVAETILPAELVNMIADKLLDLEVEQVNRMWDTKVPHRENVKKFRYDTPRTVAEKTVLRQMHSMGINAVAVRVSNPREEDGTETRGTSCYVHLSAAKSRPAMTNNLARHSTVATQSNGLWYSSLKHAGLSTACEAPHYDVQRSIDHVAGLRTSYEPGDFSQGNPTSGEVTTFSLCTGVEDAVREWDRDAVERYVEMLGLDVIPFDPHDHLKPSMAVWQFLSDR